LCTVIAHHSPGKRGSSKAHGEALGADEVAATKQALGWDPEQHFLIPDRVYEHFRDVVCDRGAAAQQEWQARFDTWARANSELAAEWRDGQAGKVGNGLVLRCPSSTPPRRRSSPHAPHRARSSKRCRRSCRRWSAA